MNIILESALIYGATGAFTGLIAGMLGIGGGMIIVPALLYIFHYMDVVPPMIEMRFAAGTSLAIMIFTAQASVRAHQRRNGIVWSALHRLWKGIIVGTVCGATLACFIPTHWLRVILGLFLLFIAAEMSFNFHFPQRKNFPAQWVNHLVSLLIGVKSGLLGIGGGALIIPYLTYCGIERRQTVGISSVCTLIIALIGTVAFIVTGLGAGDLTAWSTGYVYWPAVFWVAIPSMIFAPIGAHLTYSLPVNYLKRGFVVVLVIAAIDLLR